MMEESNLAVRRKPPSAKSPKLLTKTSILMVSVLLAANLIMTEGISYSSAGSTVPSFAPTSLNHAPTSKPSQHRSSKKGKHRKSKADSHGDAKPAFLESTSSSSSSSSSSRDRPHSSRRRKTNNRPRIQPVREEEPAKQTAFIGDAPVRRRRKSHKGSSKQHSTGDSPKPEAPKRKSLKTRMTTPSVAEAATNSEAATTIPSSTAKKSPKKHKHRRRRRRKVEIKPETTKEEEQDTVATPEIEESTPKTKGTKRKKQRKTKSVASQEKEEPAVVATTTTTTTTTPIEESVETSAPKEEIALPMLSETDSKPKRKKKRRKKHHSKPAREQAVATVDDEVEAEPVEQVAVEESAATEIEAAIKEAEPEIATPVNDENEQAIAAENDVIESVEEPEEAVAKEEEEEEVVEEAEVCERVDQEDAVDDKVAEIVEEESSPAVDEEDAVEEEEEEEALENIQEKSPEVDNVKEAVEEVVEEEPIEEEPVEETVDEAVPEEAEAEVIEEETSPEDADVEVEAEEESNESVEQVEDAIETAEEESIQESVDVDEEVVEEEIENGKEADVVEEESIIEEEDEDEGSVATSDIVVEEEEPVSEKEIAEEEIEVEEEEVDESDNDEDPGTEAQRGASEKDDEDVSSSNEGSDINPDQDVTRGGHIDTVTTESEVEEKAEEITEVSETPEVVEEEKDAENDKDFTEEPKEKPKILDRKALETSGDKDSDAVVSVVTWNLAEDSPEEEDAAFIRKFRKNGVLPDEGSDLVLISGQECENIKPRRSEGRRSREYRRLMIKMLGRGYVPLALHLLGGIQFGLFAKRSFLKEIEDVSVADVTCGIGNVFHNKGAIAAFLKIKARNQDADGDQKRAKTLRMVFVASHLAAHVKNADARDADFWRISSELEAQAPEGFLPRKPMEIPSGSSFLFDSVDRVFFCGDLNYRLDLPRELTEHAILHEDSESVENLLQHDQLIHSMAEGKAFPKFGEGKIAFMPTFKYDKESSSYDTSHKQRIPAWTDRILFQPSDGIRVLDYHSVPEAQSSDHRPVWGSYRIGMEGRVIPPAPKKKKRRKRVNYEQDFNY